MRVQTEKAFIARDGVVNYLRAQGNTGDLTWHPLFTATRELFHWLLTEEFETRLNPTRRES